MKIFKFGGASLKSAEAVMNMTEIISHYGGNRLVVIVSAMGKTTNALESILFKAGNQENYRNDFLDLIDFHEQIALRLFGSHEAAGSVILPYFDALSQHLQTCRHIPDYDERYDSIIPFGELVSSAIVHRYLILKKKEFILLDARDLVITDERFREAGIIWDRTCRNISGSVNRDIAGRYYLSQGFIGKSVSGKMTTLGREGSDFTAAIFATCLDADSVTIWKDVPGILNADPKKIKDPYLYDELSYLESAEMSYYGATVIHPRTVKPLADKNIPLYVKSFEEPSLPGTSIHTSVSHSLPPAIIFKENQCLFSFTRRDLEFINERNLGEIFNTLAAFHLKINLMQNSAVSFTVCINENIRKLRDLINVLSGNFRILYNEGLTLITVKNYTEEVIRSISANRNILLEQRTRNTYQIVTRPD